MKLEFPAQFMNLIEGYGLVIIKTIHPKFGYLLVDRVQRPIDQIKSYKRGDHFLWQGQRFLIVDSPTGEDGGDYVHRTIVIE